MAKSRDMIIKMEYGRIAIQHKWEPKNLVNTPRLTRAVYRRAARNCQRLYPHIAGMLRTL